MGQTLHWTDDMTNAALEHLEENKGTTGLYMKDRNTALEDGVKFLAQSFPGLVVKPSQLKGKFEKLWSRHRRPDSRKNPFYIEGRNALIPAYDRDTLLKQTSNNRANDRKPRQRSLDVARRRQTRASSIACNKPTRVEGKRGNNAISGRSCNLKRFATVRTNPVVLVQVLPNNLQHENVLPSSERGVSIADSDLSDLRSETPKITSTKGAYSEMFGNPKETTFTPYASLRGGAHEKRQAAVNKYLLDNPEFYLPSPSLLEHLRGVTMSKIFFAVRNLLEATKTEHDKPPQLYSSLSSSPFFDICKRVYGVGRAEDLRRTSEHLLSHSPISIKDFLRSMIATAVNEWVFDGWHDLDCETGLSAIYREELAELYPELHEQILRKSNYIFVNEKLDLKIFVAELSDRLNGALRPFLGTNLPSITSAIHTKWRNNVDEIFLSALELKAKVMLGNQQFSFMWPRAGETFDSRMMRRENNGNAEICGKVHVALFPALIQNPDVRIGQDGPKERVIFPAFVILQQYQC